MLDPPYIIAEIGNNHEGSVDVAHKMLDVAAACGAHAVKFQMFVPELLINKNDVSRIALMSDFRLSEDDFISLARHAESAGIDFFSSAFDEQSLTFLSKISSKIKIASGDNDNANFMSKASQLFEVVYVSLGLLDEKQTKEFFDANNTPKMVPLHCVSIYPHGPEDSLIHSIDVIASCCGTSSFGYSDHTTGNVCSIIAHTKGATVFEKHFTLDNNYSDYRDHKVALDPADFKKYVGALQECHSALVADAELARAKQNEVVKLIRRSAVSKTDIEVGESITKSNVVFVRPGGGIEPPDIQKLYNSKAKVKIRAGETISWEQLSGD